MSYDYEQLLDDDLAYSIVEAISEGKIEPVRLTARDYLNGRRTTKSHHLAYHLCVLYGISDEWHQSFVLGRTATWRDVGFDTLGATISMAALYWML